MLTINFSLIIKFTTEKKENERGRNKLPKDTEKIAREERTDKGPVVAGI